MEVSAVDPSVDVGDSAVIIAVVQGIKLQVPQVTGVWSIVCSVVVGVLLSATKGENLLQGAVNGLIASGGVTLAEKI